MAKLVGPSFGPAAGGPPRQLVVLLHGVGADGQDLVGLAPMLARDLPHARFVAPDGPEPCDLAPYGRQWFSLQDRRPERMLAGIVRTAPLLDAFLDEELARYGLTDADLALLGFSQGTMMSLHVGPRRQNRIAGILGYSGLLIGPDHLAAEARHRPPVLLAHGEADPVVPFAAMGQAERALKSAGFEVEAYPRPGLPHGIDGVGLALGGRFLKRVFGA